MKQHVNKALLPDLFPQCQTYFSGIQFTGTWVFTQPINILVEYSNSMFDIKIIFLKKDNPFCQLPNELIRLHEPLQWLVIVTKVNGLLNK
jgi:hypothetical protein